MPPIGLRTNLPSLAAQRFLQDSTHTLDQISERLSTGLRINKPSDDAAGLAISESLKTDSRIFNQGVRNVNDGISYLNIAEGATNSLKDILIRMRELSTQSSNGTLSNTQRQALDKEVQALVAEHNRILQTTAFNGRTIFDASNQDVTVQVGYGSITISLATTAPVTKGDGTFQAKQSFATGTGPSSVAIGDFNGDGKADLVSADRSGNTVSVLLGNGNGTFGAKQSFTTGIGPTSVVVGDFNRDGKLDLASADPSGSTVSVLLGNGNGTFGAKQSFTATAYPAFLSIGDFNGDGKSDLVSADALGSRVSVFLGNGNGTFGAEQSFTVGAQPQSVAVADFNGDGKLDLVSADYYGNTVSVLLGNGNGTFGAEQSFTAGGNPSSVVVGDFNGDGKSDLVSADYGGGAVNVLLGNGNGTFGAKQNFTTGTQPQSIAVADFNGDGKLDLVSADYGGNSVSVLLGNGNGTFGAKQSFTAGTNPTSVAVADFNGDGVSDLVSADNGANTLSVFLGNGTTTTFPGIPQISGISVATRSAALAAQGQIDGYLDNLNTISGILGAGISRFQTAADNLRVGFENFTEARSRIVDADVAEESANLAKNRILQEAGVAVLAQANQQPALVLQLLRA